MDFIDGLHFHRKLGNSNVSPCAGGYRSRSWAFVTYGDEWEGVLWVGRRGCQESTGIYS